MDKKLVDKLFHKALNDADIPFNEDHWAAMEKRLDAQPVKRRALLWLGLSGIAAAIIIAFLFTLWLVQPDSHKRPVLTQTSPEKIPGTRSPAGSGRQHSGQETSSAGELTAIAKSPEKQQAVQPYQQIAVIPGQPAAARKFISSRAKALDSVTNYARNTWPSARPAGMAGTGQFLVPYQPSVKEESNLSYKQGNNRPYLTILAAPDLTSIRGAGPQEFSANFGALYTVPLSSKFSIAVGALYAKKNYNAPFRFYQSSGQYAWGEPNQVYAACDVLDIPVGVNYQVYNRGRITVKASAGLSSYFMLREQYRFSYGPANDRFSSYEVKGKNNHLFGVGNMSVSVEQQINERLSIGVSPFIKLPLTGIGAGKSRLESKGMAISVNFQLKGPGN